MGAIQRLADDLANQIAAGEVVERPASVVKELVENAIDAGASRIQVDIEGGGISLIRVSDDGSGMAADDAALAVERHATSKIHSIDDLSHIATFGFRGEALPSIASVSRFALRTRRRDDEGGTEVILAGGGTPDARPCGGAPGTTVEVRDLFFNVPARRKFLRAPATESSHVTDVVETAALGHPELTIRLSRDGRAVREWLRTASREERVRAASEEPLTPCRGERGPLRLEAFLSPPERARAGASWLSLFVNGRAVRDRALARAVAQAYGSVLEPGRYPAGVVYLDLPPELFDVNVHPQKAEVRFTDPRALGEAVFRILADELAHAFAIPAARHRWGSAAARFDSRATAAAAALSAARGLDPGHDGMPTGGSTATGSSLADGAASSREPEADPWGLGGRPSQDAAGPTAAGPAASNHPYPLLAWRDGGGATSGSEMPFGRLHFIAQVRQTFLLCEGADGLYVLDQHAAAERVTFHRLRSAYAGRDIPVQALLFPTIVEVTASDAALVDEESAAFARVGLDVRAAGATSIAVHGIPKLLGRASPEMLVRDLIAEVGRAGGRGFSSAVDLVLATMACHGSIRAGDRVAPEEAQVLLQALDKVDFSGHCPHGRPVVTRLTWADLERKVGRR